jgi:predicted RNase H-related nuclease YkuK (DUF458 family)
MKNVVKALNTYIQEEYNLLGRFIPFKKVEQDKNFKVFKHCIFDLYYVTDNTSIKVIHKDIMAKEDAFNKDAIELELIKEIIKYVNSSDFKSLIKPEDYGG